MHGNDVSLNIIEVRKPELDAQLAAEALPSSERRVSFRRAMKRAVQNAQRFGAKGIRIRVSGRLGGADIARTEWYREGRVPLHTLRADMTMVQPSLTTGLSVLKFGSIKATSWSMTQWHAISACRKVPQSAIKTQAHIAINGLQMRFCASGAQSAD